MVQTRSADAQVVPVLSSAALVSGVQMPERHAADLKETQGSKRVSDRCQPFFCGFRAGLLLLVGLGLVLLAFPWGLFCNLLCL